MTYMENYEVFLFCQSLRGVVAPSEVNARTLEPFLRRWYDRCKDVLEDEHGSVYFSEVRSQFLAIWEGNKVKWPKRDLLAAAEFRAKALEQAHPEFLRYDSPHIQHLGNTLAELAILRGDGMVFINQKDAGRIMGRSERIGREVLLMFCADGILERTKVGHTGLASEYRYVGNEMPF